jgi:hypothetical protein
VEFFVGALAYEATASDLASCCGDVAEVNAALVVTDRDSGRSKGFGGLDVPLAVLDPGRAASQDNLTKAAKETYRRLLQLNGTPLANRPLSISEAKAKDGSRRSLFGVLRRALGEDIAHLAPDYAQFRDALEASQLGALVQDAFKPAALERVRSVLGPITFMNNRVMNYLADHQAALNELLNPRHFEELCYELLRRTDFYDLELTQRSRDGGVDIHAKRVDNGRENIYVIECKHWDPLNKVGGPIVQQTFGVMGLTRADKAMVVTSSYFSAPAKAWQTASQGQLILRNRDVLGAWITAVRGGSRDCMLWLPGDP